MSKKREIVHDEFLELLQSIKPNPGTARLFHEVVLRQWNHEYRDAIQRAAILDNEIATLHERKSRIINLFIDGGLTDSEKRAKLQENEQQLAKLNLQRIDTGQLVTEKEQIIDGAMMFMSDPGLFWNVDNIEIKKRVQDIIFPAGLTYDCQDGFRTPELSKAYLLIKKIASEEAKNLNVVAATGLEPVTPSL